ncbi:hypothetical protein Q31b_02240 [Novipirellula aureliae]|uniref:Uncharacterized protein n=1 Tax=Novipirellula aureliae TaxID=2527966 RepID=A0A5C6E5W1_9BACT|nr:hypothetical protein Q31b_02240 [Novipirellula aureliae]
MHRLGGHAKLKRQRADVWSNFKIVVTQRGHRAGGFESDNEVITAGCSDNKWQNRVFSSVDEIQPSRDYRRLKTLRQQFVWLIPRGGDNTIGEWSPYFTQSTGSLMDETTPTRIYNDGPCHPRTKLAVEAEKAYRDWFAKTAMGVPAWTQPNEMLFDQFMLARAVIKNKAVVGADHGVCVFRPDHPIEASKTRGQAQAAWIAIEDGRHFRREGIDTQTIRSVAEAKSRRLLRLRISSSNSAFL